MSTATVTSKGQITIPIDVRRRLRLETGSRVEFVETTAGSFELIPATRSIRELRGVVRVAGPARSIEEMDERVAEAVDERGHP